MAVEVIGHTYSGLQSDVDYTGTAFQHRAMKLGATAGLVTRASAPTDEVIGILKNRPPKGRSVTLQANLIATVVAGGVISRADEVTSDSLGRAVTAGAAGKSFGRAMATAETAGQLVPVLLALQTVQQ